MNFKHGDARKGKVTRLHNIWRDLFKRCYNPKSQAFRLYGEKGIKICGEWHNFVNFKTWALTAGYSPKLTIDRIDNSKGYSPENCRWATRKTQARNRGNSRLIAFHGKIQVLAAWAEEYNMSHSLLSARLGRMGWSIKRALTTRVRPCLGKL